MGNQVSRVYGFLVKRPMQRYNVDHRAEKMITKFEDPTAAPHRAPMYKSDAALLEEVRRDNPEMLETSVKKDDTLHDRLKSVYVSSTDPAPDPRMEERDTKPLPRDIRQHYEDFVPAQMRVERAGQTRTLPRGKVSLDQAVEMLTRRSETEGAFGVEEISEEYRLNKEVVTNTVRYFDIFSMMETKTRDQEDVAPDPLQAGPDWESVTSTKEDPARIKEQEERAKLEAANIKHKLRVEQERAKKNLQSGKEEKT
eukprot:TRINITY_DN42190_c0_g1_i1.p1 TRINITY_DN42190_c0_g1~~TRINITY_DN42190_c0_g1_i1.p1  ORF type:complete len:254 (-),score=116.32 TRINITY_DN42190_c0_g1_i1:144-905(-)